MIKMDETEEMKKRHTLVNIVWHPREAGTPVKVEIEGMMSSARKQEALLQKLMIGLLVPR